MLNIELARIAVAEGRGQFEKPEKMQRPPLEAVTGGVLETAE